MRDQVSRDSEKVFCLRSVLVEIRTPSTVRRTASFPGFPLRRVLPLCRLAFLREHDSRALQGRKNKAATYFFFAVPPAAADCFAFTFAQRLR